MDSIKQKVFLAVFGLSLFMLFTEYTHYQQANAPKTVTTQSVTPGNTAAAASPSPSAKVVNASPVAAIADYKSAPRATIKTDKIEAVVSSIGGDIIHLSLNEHKATEDKSKNFVILDEGGGAHTYVVRSGFLDENLPNHRTQFQLSAQNLVLQEGQDSVTLRLSAPTVNGLVVNKLITFKRGSYLAEVSYEIQNTGTTNLQTQVYFELARDDKPAEHTGGLIGGVSTYTGPAYYNEDKKYKKVTFENIAKKEPVAGDVTSKDGWVAMIQHYFVSALLPKGDIERTVFNRKLNDGFFGTGFKLPMSVAAGQTAKLEMPIYIGPQEQAKLDQIAKGLDLVVDYGWMTVIAKPLFLLLSFIHKLVANWGWAIILLTVLIKLVFFPLSAASYRSMAKMKTLMPRMKQIQELYASDPMRKNQELMNLYKTEKVNPMGGCLPILVQMPVFMALYWVLLGVVEMRQAPWLGWIHDLSAMDPYYILPVLMAISMFVQTKLNPTPPDPMQAKMMMIMPLVFSVMFLWMPSGLVLYWVVNNVLSIAQQWYITRMIEGEKK